MERRLSRGAFEAFWTLVSVAWSDHRGFYIRQGAGCRPSAGPPYSRLLSMGAGSQQVRPTNVSVASSRRPKLSVWSSEGEPFWSSDSTRPTDSVRPTGPSWQRGTLGPAVPLGPDRHGDGIPRQADVGPGKSDFSARLASGSERNAGSALPHAAWAQTAARAPFLSRRIPGLAQFLVTVAIAHPACRRWNESIPHGKFDPLGSDALQATLGEVRGSNGEGSAR
jgi:hypothetical protein